MSALDPELDQFLDVVGKLLDGGVGDPEAALDLDADDVVARRLHESGALDLAVETADLDDALRWLAEVVARAARHDPSVAFALAARFVGQRALARAGHEESDAATSVTATLAPRGDGAEREVTVAHRFSADRVVVIGPDQVGAVVATLTGSHGNGPRRVGLAGALLGDVVVKDAEALGGDVRETLQEWSLLTAAVAIGIAEGAVALSTSYAVERQQFGTRLIEFTGLRAILGEMALRVSQARALMETLLLHPEAGFAEHGLVATVGRMAVDVCIDAIQVHGGYGYIDEYPVAGLLRDAISLQARCVPRREAVAALAASPSISRG